MQLQTVGAMTEGHEGEVYACTYSPDGSLILSAGWDGFLRIWDASTGRHLSAFQAGPKPLSCCAFAPDGQSYLSGSMEGVLSFWNASTQELQKSLVAHTRPISAILYSPNQQQLLTSSWDRKIILRKVGKEAEGASLSGHHDIVAGCRFSADGHQLLSWSHDGTIRWWKLDASVPPSVLVGHDDRITAGALSEDGNWAVTGGRDGVIKLWDMQNLVEANSVILADEVRGLLFLLDGMSLVVVTAGGGMLLLSIPNFEVLFEMALNIRVMSCELAPSGKQVALGGEDGRVHLMAVEGVENAPLLVTAALTQKRHASMLDRMMGKSKLMNVYLLTCPSCRHETELPSLPGKPFTCPACQQALRVNSRVKQMVGS